MAYIKIVPIKGEYHLQRALAYILNPDKTEKLKLASSYMCSTENAYYEFEEIRNKAIKKGNNLAHQLYQSFSPEDKITPQKAMEIGKKIMAEIYPNYQYVIATHTDKEHIHNHIIINSVNFVDFKKLHSNSKSLQNIRERSDELCKKYGLSVIEPQQKHYREQLKSDIDTVVKTVNNFDEFLSRMQELGYEIKLGKHIVFKPKSGKQFLRTKSLGSAYTEYSIKDKIINNADIKNKKTTVYNDKTIKRTKRKKLKADIDEALKICKTFDEFIQYMKNNNYQIKQGNNLAFLPVDGERFLRSDSLGYSYSENMLRLRFEDIEQYHSLMAENAGNNVNKIISSDRAYRNRYIDSKNINIKIQMLNFVDKTNIKSYAELQEKILEIQAQIDKGDKEARQLNIQISEKRSIINSIQTYWQYKPVAEQLRSIKDTESREKFSEEHRKEISRFKAAICILNASKDIDGNLPKKSALLSQINELERQRINVINQNKQLKKDLTNYQNIEFNIIKSIDVDKNTYPAKEQSTNAISKDI